jgi:aspartate kinase
MKDKFQVFKFGGSSLKTADLVVNCGEIIRSQSKGKVMVVVSAMGKTTDAMEKVVRAHFDQTGEAQDLLNQVKSQHVEIVRQLFPEGGIQEVLTSINDAFVEVDWVLEEPPSDNYDFLYDQIVGTGEVVSSIIVQSYLQHIGLNAHWVDARDIIQTDDIFREGWVQWDATTERFQQNLVPKLDQFDFFVTQGFIGTTSENFTTTLGREGSDYTAAIFSFLLDAEAMTIWKDVDGVYTGDPRFFDNVIHLNRLSYKEAIEMTYYGAKVIHPKTIKPLQNKSIPLYVKSFLEPKSPGTCISDEYIEDYPPIVSVESNQALLQISTRDFSFVAEHHISKLFNYISELRLHVNMMQNSAISFSVCVTDMDDKVEKFIRLVEAEFKVSLERNLSLISIRHYRKDVMENLKIGKMVLLEERSKKTFQMVVKEVEAVKWK